MLAYTSHFFCLVYFSPVGLFSVSYICPLFSFLCFFCNKCEIWWLYQSSTVNRLHTTSIIKLLLKNHTVKVVDRNYRYFITVITETPHWKICHLDKSI